MEKIGHLINSNFLENAETMCTKHRCYYVRPKKQFFEVYKKAPIDLRNGFCPQCVDENKDIEIKQINEQVQAKEQGGYFKRFSLFKNSNWYKYTFSEFKTDNGGKNKELEQVYSDAQRTALLYCKFPNQNFNTLMYGAPGTGKTHLATAILISANSVSKPEQKCLFLSLNKLLEKRIENTRNAENNIWTSHYMQKVIKNADIVVIDDLGAESPNKTATPFTQTTLNEIYDANGRIITTTNLTLQQLRETYGERLISRIMAGTGMEFKTSDGKKHNNMIDFSKLTDYRFKHSTPKLKNVIKLHDY
ncbi:MAG: hypothetical protein [Bacteriophage sp.]|nr:MAG: hypothetical protein [Bacteriophage sp.]